MPIINFPPAFDLEYYKKSYPELNSFSDIILREHYKRFAVVQGHSTCAYDRREHLQAFLRKIVDEFQLKILEIGCGGNPFLVGDTVKYFETLDCETLKRNYLKVGRSIDNCPKDFDFISPTGDLSVVNDKFDIIFSAHVVEHVPDLIEHLQNVGKILNKGGLYILIVPDKRYCFDYYNAESTITEVIDAFVNERKIPRLADVINIVYTRTHNNAVRHWLGDHGERYGYRNTPLEPDAHVQIMDEQFFDDGKGINSNSLLNLIEKYAEALDKEEYISAHNWRFTPDSFGYIVNLLNALGFINLPLYRLCHTIWGRQEFIVMLEKN